MTIIIRQKYRHYKTKNVYEIVAIGRNSETLEEMVVSGDQVTFTLCDAS